MSHSTATGLMAQHWHISSIQIKAFKSFGPSWCTFEIPEPYLSGIVGPNGCGKSNLLEAVCFATAGSSSVLRLSVRTLQDVISTDAGNQRPEVRLCFTKGKETHFLEACLTLEGSRSYKIDGKAKTGTQVKDFLKVRGILVDSTTVIQQAAVTQLSDSNNAQALAQLVATASGLDSWNQETAAARQEISRTAKALKDIQSNINTLQSSVAAEDAAFKAAAEAAELEQQLELQLQELLLGLQHRQHQLQHQLETEQLTEEKMKGSAAARAEQLQHLLTQRKAFATQQAQLMEQLDSKGGSSSSSTIDAVGAGNGTGSISLIQRIAAAEAEVAGVQAAIAARATLAAELRQDQQLLQQHKAHCELLEQRLASKQREAASAAGKLAEVKSTSDAAALLQQQTQSAAKQAAAAAADVQQQLLRVTAQQAEVQQTHGRLHTLQAQLQHLTTTAHTPVLQTAAPGQLTAPSTPTEAKYALASATAAAAAASATVEKHAQHLGALQQQLLMLQMQTQAAERPLTPAAVASLLAGLGTSSSTTPLHACFALKDSSTSGLTPQQLEQLLTPLSVIAGPAVLQTLVSPSVREANTLLAAATAGAGRAGSSYRRLKIWPLDNLSVRDTQQQQRAAQQALGQHAVILPLDVLEFDAVHYSAMLRAFGSFVIAADDSTAAALVERFGLSVVTLQGTISRKGSMAGGWTGSSGSYARTYWANKQQHDITTAQLAACQQQLAASQAQQQQLNEQRDAAEAQVTAAQQQMQLFQELQHAQAEAAAAVSALQQEEEQLQDLTYRSDHLQAQLLQYQAAGLKDCDNGTGTHIQRTGSGSREPTGAAALQQLLQAEVDKAAAAVAAAQHAVDSAQDQVEDLSATIDALECRLASSKEPEQQQDQLQQALQGLQQLQQQRAHEQAATAALQKQLQQLEAQTAQLDKQIKTAEAEQQGMVQQQLSAAADAKAVATALQKSQQELKQLLKGFSSTEVVQAFSSGLLPLPAAAAGHEAGAAAATAARELTDVQLQQLSRHVRQLQAKLSQLEVPDLLPGQKEALAARLGQVAELRQQAEAVKAAASSLEGQMARDAQQVYAANDVVYEGIAAGFSQLCRSLLPSLELQLVRTGSQAHEGLQFRFRRLQDTTAAFEDAPADNNWQTHLGQLSGGQRTLVSLAMLLAVARTASACGLLLLDEVDAALDEVNQGRASALLRQLSHDSASACQIVCVTHNHSFQESCDGFVRVTKSATGHSIPAGGLGGSAPSGGRAAAAAAADGAGSSKKGRKQRRLTAAVNSAGRFVPAEGVVAGKRAAGTRAKKVRFEQS